MTSPGYIRQQTFAVYAVLPSISNNIYCLCDTIEEIGSAMGVPTASVAPLQATALDIGAAIASFPDGSARGPDG